MKINAAKRETQLLGYGSGSFSIKLEGQDLKHIDEFLYLGGLMNSRLILRQYGIPDNIVTIIQSVYKSSKSCIKLNEMTGDWFDVVTGVRQGCILSPLLFAIVMDWIIKKSLRNYKGELQWTDSNRLCDLDYADDISLIKTS